MKNIKIFLTLIMIVCACIANAQVSFEPDSIVTYKSTAQGDLKMTIFKPKKYKVSDDSPVIVFFFGGGWSGGSTDQFYQQARYFSDKGYLAISAEYRIFSKHKTSPFESVTDAKSAVRWIRAHASELGVNPNKLIASGGSAGGHIAACTGVIEGYDEEGEDLKISSVPNAMILFNPVLDTTEKGYGVKKVGEDRKTDISPCNHVHLGIPPTLIFHGTADKTVPFENAERFAFLMNEVGNTCELVSFEGEDHGFFNGSFFRKNSTDEVFNITMKKSFEFLNGLHL
ncbi:alpha/beta hydrolase [Formosa undariae]|uniref:Alpha/beta hydrolase n=1 Tax=Formosa undariae TaxID=1325436 RepID=A0ABV5EZZ2_9FLAO